MIEAVEAIEHVQKVSGTLDKMSLLKLYANVPGFKEILKFIYNPYLKTGLSDAKLRTVNRLGTEYTPVDFEDIMEYLSVHNTGSLADVTRARQFIETVRREYAGNPSQEFAVEIAYAIVTQDLQIGVGVTQLNKVYGADFIPKTGCMLGTLYGNIPANKLKWPYIITEKFDGIRRIILKENGVSRAYSRSGHEDTGLVQIMNEMAYLPDNFMYDGELTAQGLFRDSIALRQATASIAQSKGLKYGLDFNVFDMVPIDEFKAGTSSEGALNRKIRLGATLRDESIAVLYPADHVRLIQAYGIDEQLRFIKATPILGLANTVQQIEPIVEAIWLRHFEGVMLNTVDGKYEIKRSKQLLKMKHTEEFILPVIDMEEGTNKYEDMLGALVVEYKGNRVGVGSGFTDADRKRIWDHPATALGKKIEIESFGESTNSAGQVSLNCPIFLRFVDEEHE